MIMIDDSNPILDYLSTHGVVDKDKSAKTASARTSQKRIKQQPRKLDLHGLTSDQAAIALRAALSDASEKRIRQVLVIHGQGWHSGTDTEPVLKKLVLAMLENELSELVKSFRPAKPEEGGGGATMVSIVPLL